VDGIIEEVRVGWGLVTDESTPNGDSQFVLRLRILGSNRSRGEQQGRDHEIFPHPPSNAKRIQTRELKKLKTSVA
jgi:hypothetical protein